MNEIRQILRNEYSKLSDDDAPYRHSQVLYTIIQIKIENKDQLLTYSQSLYLDIKLFIDASIASVKRQAFGYDTFDLIAVFDLYAHISYKEAISINKYLLRQLKVDGYEEEFEQVKEKGNEISLNSYKERSAFLYIIKYLAYHSSKNLGSVLASLFIILGLYVIILLPVQTSSYLTFFKIRYDAYTNSLVLNHILNLLAGTFEIENDFKITPLNPTGVVLMVLGKVLFFVLIIKFLIEEILKKLKE